MQMESKPSLVKRLKTLIIGSARSPLDKSIFHKLSLIAFFAWVGIGADGLSSSAYGPEEAFRALHGHTYLGIFVALGSVLTIFVISASYSQIIELFPSGGGGYLVASKLLSPSIGMFSGCALLIDYVLTITISVASGADAIFSFFPPQWGSYKVALAITGVIVLLILNLRGIKESVIPLVPIFLLFVLTHAFGILYGLITHLMDFPEVTRAVASDVQRSQAELGLAGMFFLLLRAYSVGAGTYTGIEAVSNGIPILREPKVQTAKRTMTYMAVSLAFTVLGLMFCYVLYRVQHVPGKTLNAVLFERIASGWDGNSAYVFVLLTLFSEAAILFIAAQAGFLDGPRVLSNMALDRWFPTRFTALSDRFVAHNGVMIMGIAAAVVMLLTQGSVHFLVVLYSINVFMTFLLSQLGMVRHWWSSRKVVREWWRKLFVNGVGLVLTTFILVSVTVIKFHEGGWITLLITGTLIGVAVIVRRHYNYTGFLLRRLDTLVQAAEASVSEEVLPSRAEQRPKAEYSPQSKTAVILVNGFGGLGLHTLFGVMRLFGEIYKNFVFVQIGVVDTGNFKGAMEIEHLQVEVKKEVDRYVDYMKRHGYYAEGFSSIGNDVIEEVTKIAPEILERFSQSVFFGGQLVFPQDSFLSRFLHNYIVFAIQRKFYHEGIPFVILPIKV